MRTLISTYTYSIKSLGIKEPKIEPITLLCSNFIYTSYLFSFQFDYKKLFVGFISVLFHPETNPHHFLPLLDDYEITWL